MPSPSPPALALHACGLAWLARGRRARGLAALLAGHVLLVAGPLHVPVDGRRHLTVLDVGQADCLLLRSPGGRSLVVDAGGPRAWRFDPGERVVAPQLWKRGVSSIDAIVATHAQLDHVAGIPFLLRAFRVKEVWEGPAARGDRVFRQLDAAVAASGAVRRGVAAFASIAFVKFAPYAPARAGRWPSSRPSRPRSTPVAPTRMATRSTTSRWSRSATMRSGGFAATSGGGRAPSAACSPLSIATSTRRLQPAPAVGLHRWRGLAPPLQP